jgi:hypothetical protein
MAGSGNYPVQMLFSRLAASFEWLPRVIIGDGGFAALWQTFVPRVCPLLRWFEPVARTA